MFFWVVLSCQADRKTSEFRQKLNGLSADGDKKEQEEVCWVPTMYVHTNILNNMYLFIGGTFPLRGSPLMLSVRCWCRFLWYIPFWSCTLHPTKSSENPALTRLPALWLTLLLRYMHTIHIQHVHRYYVHTQTTSTVIHREIAILVLKKFVCRCCSSLAACLCRKRKEQPRTIVLGRPLDHKYPTNAVKNTKYNVITFVPLVCYGFFNFFLFRFLFVCFYLRP